MKYRKVILASAAGLLVAANAFAGLNEDAPLSATIGAGSLEIVPASVVGPWAQTNPVTSSGSLQSDAIEFVITGITLNDLNSDGQGFTLTAAPDATLSDGSNTLPLGTTPGFSNPSDVGLVVDGGNSNLATYADGTGTAGLTIDYTVNYDVPALAPSGTYTGVVAFTIAAL